MTRRGWQWALGMVACGTLLPACTHTVPGVIGNAVPMGGDEPAAVASGSPYNAQPSANDKPKTLVPAVPVDKTKPNAALAAQPKVQHRDTLTPEPDPTPGPEPLSATVTAVAAAPKNMGLWPTLPKAAEKSTPVASLTGLTPASSPRPQQLPPSLPPAPVQRVVATEQHTVATSAQKALSPPLVEAMRNFLENHPGEAMLCLKGYDKDNQDLLLLLLPLAARLAEGKLTASNAQDTMYFYDQLNSLLVTLRPRLSLVIDKICFCRDIRGFGMYQPLPDSPAFRRGDHVDIYVEVRNFSSTKQAGPHDAAVYVTRLKTSAEIMTRDKRTKVWPAGNERFVFHRDGPDVCQALRHDYFDHCYFTLPQDLPPGAYTLLLQVEDMPTHRVARESLDFIVR